MDYATDVAVDSFGNTYLVGFFKGVVDFDPGPGYHPINFSSSTNKGNVYCVKLSPTGQYIWAKQIGGVLYTGFGTTGNLTTPKIEIDNNNNIYISGIYDYRVDFDPNPSQAYYIPNPEMSKSTFDFISKYDSNGNLIWAKRIGSNTFNSNSTISQMKVDHLGNIIIGGTFNSTVDFDPGNSVNNLITDSNDDIYILKLSTDGNFTWVKQIGSIMSSEQINGLDINNESIAITGLYKGSVDFDPGSNTYNLNSQSGTEDIFISKYNLLDGTLNWAKTFGSSQGWDRGSSIALDAIGNVYANGIFRKTVDFNPDPAINYDLVSIGTTNMYVLKLNNQGQFSWAKNFAAYQNNFNYAIEAGSISFKNNQLFVSGGYLLQVVDQNYQPIITYNSGGNRDIFIVGMNSTGDLNWSMGFGGTLEDFIAQILHTNDNKFIAVGGFKNSVDFNPNLGTILTSASGNYDSFVSKLDMSSLLKVREVPIKNELLVYPIPSSDYIYINNKNTYRYSIFDVSGKFIRKGVSNENSKIDIQDLEKGIYLISIESENFIFDKKFIKN